MFLRNGMQPVFHVGAIFAVISMTRWVAFYSLHHLSAELVISPFNCTRIH